MDNTNKMNSHRLKDNPFFKLQATPRDTDRKLVARATDLKLLTGEDMHEAQEMLLKPQGRLDAEIAFLPGAEEGEILRLRAVIEGGREQLTFPVMISSMKTRQQSGNEQDCSCGKDQFRPESALALLNGAAAMLERWELVDSESAAAAAFSLACVMRRIDANEVIEKINQDRTASGRELLENRGEITFRLGEHKRALLDMLCDRIIVLPEEEVYKAEEQLTDAYCDEKGEYAHLPVLDEVVSVHLAHHHAGAAAAAKSKIRKEIEDYTDYIARNPVQSLTAGGDMSVLRERYNVREKMTLEIVEQLQAWNRITCHQRKIIQTKGYTQNDSRSLFTEAHNFLVEMVNKHHDIANARRLIRTIQDVFWDLSKEERDLIEKNKKVIG